MAYNCDPNVLLIASSCFVEPATGKQDRRAIEIYARIKELAAVGGANYSASIASLLKAMTGANGVSSWRNLSSNQRESISTFRTVADANTNGAAIPTDINALKKAAACYKALGEDDQKNVLAFLSCAISVFNKASGGGESED